jgi:hypothetical protein
MLSARAGHLLSSAFNGCFAAVGLECGMPALGREEPSASGDTGHWQSLEGRCASSDW